MAQPEMPLTAAARLAEAEAPVSCDAGDLASLRLRLVRLAMRLIWNREDAEDIVQETFALLLRTTPPVATARRPAWLWRTVCNQCLNHRRRRKAAPLCDGDVEAVCEPDRPLVTAEYAERLRAALDQLPAQQRMATVLRCMEDQGYDAVAEIMQITPAAARTHVHLARRRLAELLEDIHANVQ